MGGSPKCHVNAFSLPILKCCVSQAWSVEDAFLPATSMPLHVILLHWGLAPGVDLESLLGLQQCLQEHYQHDRVGFGEHVVRCWKQ